MAKLLPTWRKIEQVLIELLREEGFEITQYKGESFTSVVVDAMDGNLTETEINLGDFARHLEERL